MTSEVHAVNQVVSITIYMQASALPRRVAAAAEMTRSKENKNSSEDDAKRQSNHCSCHVGVGLCLDVFLYDATVSFCVSVTVQWTHWCRSGHQFHCYFSTLMLYDMSCRFWFSWTHKITCTSTSLKSTEPRLSSVGSLHSLLHWTAATTDKASPLHSFNVSKLSTNQKPICSFLLVFHRSYMPTFYHFKDIMIKNLHFLLFFPLQSHLKPVRDGSPWTSDTVSFEACERGFPWTWDTVSFEACAWGFPLDLGYSLVWSLCVAVPLGPWIVSFEACERGFPLDLGHSLVWSLWARVPLGLGTQSLLKPVRGGFPWTWHMKVGFNKKLSCHREAARCFMFVCSQLQHTYSAVIYYHLLWLQIY